MNVLTIEDVKNILKLSDKQAKALIHTEGFPSKKIGREYRVLEDDLNAWLKQIKKVKLDYSKC